MDKLPSAYPFALVLPQCDTERVLEEFLNSLGIQIDRQVELLNFSDTGEKSMRSFGELPVLKK